MPNKDTRFAILVGTFAAAMLGFQVIHWELQAGEESAATVLVGTRICNAVDK
mgnify:CR=1 FL=1